MNRRDKEKCDKSHSCTVITLSSLSCIHVVIKAPVKNTLGSFVNGLNTWAYCLDDLCWTRGNISTKTTIYLLHYKSWSFRCFLWSSLYLR